MLAALTGVAAMSQAMRTMATVVAPDLTKEFGLTPDQLVFRIMQRIPPPEKPLETHVRFASQG